MRRRGTKSRADRNPLSSRIGRDRSGMPSPLPLVRASSTATAAAPSDMEKPDQLVEGSIEIDRLENTLATGIASSLSFDALYFVRIGVITGIVIALLLVLLPASSTPGARIGSCTHVLFFFTAASIRIAALASLARITTLPGPFPLIIGNIFGTGRQHRCDGKLDILLLDRARATKRGMGARRLCREYLRAVS